MKKHALLLVLVTAVLLAFPVIAFAGGGFDQFGYNYQARLFVGPADGVDRNLDGTVWGDPTYANDHLVMKWSSAWDAARFDGAAWTCDAWEDNEWNGMVPGSSGETWHYRLSGSVQSFRLATAGARAATPFGDSSRSSCLTAPLAVNTFGTFSHSRPATAGTKPTTPVRQRRDKLRGNLALSLACQPPSVLLILGNEICP